MTLALLIIVLATGAAGTIYELVWFRMLTPVLGNSAWSLAAVLSAYMAGLSLGARWLGPLADRFERPWRSAALLLEAVQSRRTVSSWGALNRTKKDEKGGRSIFQSDGPRPTEK